jgi:organic hydroperoxide reductase OsmC/OhrA
MKPAHFRPKRCVYRTSVVWQGGGRAIQRSEGRPPIEVASPPEFRGPEGVWTPEHLLVASLESCILLTFLCLARRAGVALVSYESETEGTLEQDAAGRQFTAFTVRPRVVIAPAGDVGAAVAALQSAADACLVHRSLKGMVRLEPEVSAAPA